MAGIFAPRKVYQLLNILSDGAEQPIKNRLARKNIFLVPIILGLAGFMTLLLILGIIVSIKGFYHGKNDSLNAIHVGDKFIDSMGHHNYSAARSLLTNQLQLLSPTSNLKDVEMLIEKNHGSFVTRGQPQWLRRESKGQVTVYLSYPIQFTQSGSQVTVTLFQTNKGYQIHDYRYDL